MVCRALDLAGTPACSRARRAVEPLGIAPMSGVRCPAGRYRTCWSRRAGLRLPVQPAEPYHPIGDLLAVRVAARTADYCPAFDLRRDEYLREGLPQVRAAMSKMADQRLAQRVGGRDRVDQAEHGHDAGLVASPDGQPAVEAGIRRRMACRGPPLPGSAAAPQRGPPSPAPLAAQVQRQARRRGAWRQAHDGGSPAAPARPDRLNRPASRSHPSEAAVPGVPPGPRPSP